MPGKPYRNKPIEVVAEKVTRDNIHDLAVWCGGLVKLQTLSANGFGNVPVYLEVDPDVQNVDGEYLWNGGHVEDVTFLGTPSRVIVHSE